MPPEESGQGGDVQPVPTPANAGIPLVEGGNPAWNDVIQYIPEDKRPEVVPHFQKWDQHVNELNEKYSAWKNFADNGIDPEQVQGSLQLASLIESQPQLVYSELGKFLQQYGMIQDGTTNMQPESKESTEADEGTTTTAAEADFVKHPEFQRLKQTNEKLAEIVLNDYKQKQEAERIQKEEQAFESELQAVSKKYGEVDSVTEQYITMRMLANPELSVEQAYQQVTNDFNQVRGSRRPSYNPIGSGGMVPTAPVKPSKMDNKGVKDLVVQMLEHSQNE